MPQIRHNIATGEWVIVAPERAGRPKDFTAAKRTLQKASSAYLAACPFCPGNEHQTPPEVLRLPHDDGPWQARVVPNKFAALQKKDGQEQCSEGVYRALAGVGWHEVVIETPRHNAPPALQSDEEVARTLTAFQMRGLEMAQDPHVAHVLYVKNHGPDAGTSREHPHAQIMALPLVPPRTQARWEAARHYLDEHGACPLCALWQSEVASGERIVAASERFVAFALRCHVAVLHLDRAPRTPRRLLPGPAGRVGRPGRAAAARAAQDSPGSGRPVLQLRDPIGFRGAA